jgi:hypothetical protein
MPYITNISLVTFVEEIRKNLEQKANGTNGVDIFLPTDGWEN